MLAEIIFERTAPGWVGLLVCGGLVLVLLGIVVAVVYLVTGTKDQRRREREERP